MDLPESLHWNSSRVFGAGDYDFDGEGLAAGDPWDTILTLRLGTREHTRSSIPRDRDHGPAPVR
jgi:hypothetical protein